MENIRSLISADLRRIDLQLQHIVKENSELYTELKQFLNNNSKKIRSILAILYLKMNNIEITEALINVLTAGELIHNASLLHDDVIDNSEYRRGKKTIWSKFNPHISILMGDYLLSLAVQKLLSVEKNEILPIFLECTNSMANAEIIQYELKGRNPSSEEYINICRGKTANLFIAILKSVSLLTGLDEKKSTNFGEKFGIFFQLKNDTENESIVNDESNNIKTAYNIFGIEKTQILIDNYKEEMRSILNKSPDNVYRKGLEELLEIL